jgi:hypothetical protein
MQESSIRVFTKANFQSNGKLRKFVHFTRTKATVLISIAIEALQSYRQWQKYLNEFWELTAYFDEEKLFSYSQHGFRRNHSCETAIHELMSTCHKQLEKKLASLLLFVGFKKAFDPVDPQFLLTDDTILGQSSENYEDLLSKFQQSIEVFYL